MILHYSIEEQGLFFLLFKSQFSIFQESFKVFLIQVLHSSYNIYS